MILKRVPIRYPFFVSRILNVNSNASINDYICPLTNSPMKRLFTLLGISAALMLTSSCEKCATCTSVSDDPLTAGETLTDEICGIGRDYDDQVTIYERANWDCSTAE